jgi:hypothetical protein
VARPDKKFFQIEAGQKSPLKMTEMGQGEINLPYRETDKGEIEVLVEARQEPGIDHVTLGPALQHSRDNPDKPSKQSKSKKAEIKRLINYDDTGFYDKKNELMISQHQDLKAEEGKKWVPLSWLWQQSQKGNVNEHLLMGMTLLEENNKTQP